LSGDRVDRLFVNAFIFRILSNAAAAGGGTLLVALQLERKYVLETFGCAVNIFQKQVAKYKSTPKRAKSKSL
jgi:hypothetical protein